MEIHSTTSTEASNSFSIFKYDSYQWILLFQRWFKTFGSYQSGDSELGRARSAPSQRLAKTIYHSNHTLDTGLVSNSAQHFSGIE